MSFIQSLTPAYITRSAIGGLSTALSVAQRFLKDESSGGTVPVAETPTPGGRVGLLETAAVTSTLWAPGLAHARTGDGGMVGVTDMLLSSEVGTLSAGATLLAVGLVAGLYYYPWKIPYLGAKFLSGRDFSERDLKKLDLSRRDLSGSVFDGAGLERASLERAGLERASFKGALLVGANLADANLTGANLSLAWFDRANFNDARLAGADLSFSWFAGACFVAASLDRASFDGASLVSAVLKGASLNGASLNGASLNGANFSLASLKGANLVSANLSLAILNDVSLKGADLAQANLTGVTISRRTDFSGANFEGASLGGRVEDGESREDILKDLRSQNHYLIQRLAEEGWQLVEGVDDPTDSVSLVFTKEPESD